VDVCPQPATIAHMLRVGVDLVLAKRSLTVLHRQPGRPIGHVIDVGNIGGQELRNGNRAIVERLQQKLRNVRAHHVTGSEASKQVLRRDRLGP